MPALEYVGPARYQEESSDDSDLDRNFGDLELALVGFSPEASESLMASCEDLLFDFEEVTVPGGTAESQPPPAPTPTPEMASTPREGENMETYQGTLQEDPERFWRSRGYSPSAMRDWGRWDLLPQPSEDQPSEDRPSEDHSQEEQSQGTESLPPTPDSTVHLTRRERDDQIFALLAQVQELGSDR